MRLSRRVVSLEKLERERGRDGCCCGGRPVYDLVYIGRASPHQGSDPNSTYLPKGAADPPPRVCPACGRGRNQVVINYVDTVVWRARDEAGTWPKRPVQRAGYTTTPERLHRRGGKGGRPWT